MDHLPWPTNPRFQPFQIPYICPEPFADVSGYEVPRLNRSFRSEPESLPPWYDCSNDRLAPRLQYWLFFGTLKAILGQSFVVHDFVSIAPDSQTSHVSLKSLENHVKALRLHRSEFALLRRHAQSELDRLPPSVHEQVCLVALSVDVLIWTVSSLLLNPLFSLRESIRYPLDLYEFGNRMSCATSSLLRSKMEFFGWCQYNLEQSLSTRSVALLSYILAMPNDVALHQKCTQQQCTAWNIDERNYETRHVDGQCSCDFIAVNIERVIEIISKGGIPLISVRVGDLQDVQLDVVEYESGRPYIAFSHVLADGLGNFRQNALPTCQLHQLTSYLKLYRPRLEFLDQGEDADGIFPFTRLIAYGTGNTNRVRYFWLDTLCGPIRPEHQAWRNAAITSMARVYALAEHVIVLDSSVQKITDKPILEREVSMLISPWMSRCWTYQEASLAPAFSFCSGSDLVNIRERDVKIQRTLTDDRSLFIETRMRKEISLEFGKMPSYTKSSIVRSDFDLEDMFEMTWRGLARRSTSTPVDRSVILAVMSGFNASEILSLRPEHRVPAILRAQQSSLPLSLLFSANDQVGPQAWIPKAVAGNLSFKRCYRYFSSDESLSNSQALSCFMRWNPSSPSLSFSAATAGAALLRVNAVEMNLSDNATLCIPIIESLAGMRLTIQLIVPDAVIGSLPRERSLCFILEDYFEMQELLVRDKKSEIGWARAACCQIHGTGSKEDTILLEFVSSTRYKLDRASSRVIGLALKHPQQLMLSAAQDTVCTLICDNAEIPELRYRRPEAPLFQSSLTYPIFSMVFVVWFGYILSHLAPDAAELTPVNIMDDIERYVGKIGPDWYFDFSRKMLKYLDSKFAIPIGMALTRLMYFWYVDFHRMTAITNRVRAERYAESFRFETVDSWENHKARGLDHRLDKEWTYQYKPWWLVLIPLAFYPLLIIFYPKLPISPLQKRMFTRMFVAFGLEPVVRVLGEAVWRYFGFDTRGIRRERRREKQTRNSGADGLAGQQDIELESVGQHAVEGHL